MKFVSYNALAKKMGVALRTVCYWTSKGKLVKNELGKIDVDLPVNKAFLSGKGAPDDLFTPGIGADFASLQQVNAHLAKATEIGLGFTESEMIQEYLSRNPKAVVELSNATFSSFIKITKDIIERIKAEADAGIRQAKLLELRGDTISLEIAIQINDEVGIQLDKMAQELPSKIADRLLDIAKNSETPIEDIKSLLQVTYSDEIQKTQNNAFQAMKKAAAENKKQGAKNEPDNEQG